MRSASARREHLILDCGLGQLRENYTTSSGFFSSLLDVLGFVYSRPLEPPAFASRQRSNEKPRSDGPGGARSDEQGGYRAMPPLLVPPPLL